MWHAAQFDEAFNRQRPVDGSALRCIGQRTGPRPGRLDREIFAAQGHPSRCQRDQAENSAQECRLPGPIWPDETDNLSRFHFEVDGINNRGATKADAYPFSF